MFPPVTPLGERVRYHAEKNINNDHAPLRLRALAARLFSRTVDERDTTDQPTAEAHRATGYAPKSA